MPELPEVESARTVIARAALHRVITEVDDTDSFVCRPHRPGEIRAALLDQDAIAGIGNLLADQILWQAKISPARPVGELTRPETDRLLRALRATVRGAVDGGGVHTLSVIPFRRPEARCPRCGTPMAHGTVGGRTTWWCPREQAYT